MDDAECISRLLERLSVSENKHSINITKQTTLKDAHMYCVIHNISSQQSGTLLEKYIICKFNFQKHSASACMGDASREGKNWEIKTSLGGSTHSKFNFVQIRLSHNIDYYLFTCYHLTKQNANIKGELYIFRVPKEDMGTLITSYGNYAHGTIKKFGKITAESLNNSDREYAIRPKYGDRCWKALLPFRITDLADSQQEEVPDSNIISPIHHDQ